MRIAVFFLNSTALTALLPLVARQLEGGGAGTFTLLLAAMGLGAISMAFFMSRIRTMYSRDGLVLRGIVVHAAGMSMAAMTSQTWVALAAMFIAGAAWIVKANTLSVSLQLGLPDWVRARAMSVYQMAIMGASAAGAALWGQVATYFDLGTSLYLASASCVLLMVLTNRFMPDTGTLEDITPKRVFTTPNTDQPPTSGRVMIAIDYQVDVSRAAEFRQLMLDESRRGRLQNGALSWELLHDLNEPGHFTEIFVDETWTDHLRRFDRVTAVDVSLRDRKQAFHIGDAPPKVSRYLMESTV